MKNYFKIIGKTILDGFYSIGDGMSTLNLYPIKKVRILNDEESVIEDYNAIKSDWETVGNGLKKAMKYSSLENRV